MTAAVKLFKLRRAKGRPVSSALNSSYHSLALERTCAESVAYHSATTIGWNMDGITDPGLLHELAEFCQDSPFPDAPPWSLSPILGLPFSFFELLLKIEKMVRFNRTDLDPVAVASALSEVDAFEVICASESLITDNSQNEHVLGSKLYIIAARVRLLALAPATTPTTKELAAQVEAGLVVLSFIDLTTPFSRYYAWPGMVLGCAIDKDSDMKFLNAKIEQVSKCGYVARAIETVSTVWWDKNHLVAR
jgi:hypothetical protein